MSIETEIPELLIQAGTLHTIITDYDFKIAAGENPTHLREYAQSHIRIKPAHETYAEEKSRPRSDAIESRMRALRRLLAVFPKNCLGSDPVFGKSAIGSTEGGLYHSITIVRW